MKQLFISYRHSQLETVRELETRLKAAGIKVVRDENEVQTFESISATIMDLLAGSHAMLAVVSEDYPLSRFCQWELTAAYLAAQRLGGEPRQRLFVLNLCGENKAPFEALPPELKDARYAESIEEAVAEVPGKMAAINGTFGAQGLPQMPVCHGRVLTGSPRFVGREQDIWRVHAALMGSKNPMVTGHVGPDLAEVSGLGGIGKTLLAEEYGLRFGAAYPGGVFWLDAYGSYNPEKPDIETFRASCVEQHRKVAQSLGMKPPRDETLENLQASLRGAIAKENKRCLWVVDDIPTGLSDHLAEVKQWFSPHPELAPTLVTTRSREYKTIGEEIALDLLDHGAARQLLQNHKIDLDKQREEADRLIDRLGGHALALDIAGAAIEQFSLPIGQYLAELDEAHQLRKKHCRLVFAQHHKTFRTGARFPAACSQPCPSADPGGIRGTGL